MATSSSRSVSVSFTGDVQAAPPAFTAAANATSPGGLHMPYALSSGFNSIAVPVGATGATITKPTGNTVALTLKGITGDTGILLSTTDPDSISLPVGATTIGLTAGSNVTVWITWT